LNEPIAVERASRRFNHSTSPEQPFNDVNVFRPGMIPIILQLASSETIDHLLFFVEHRIPRITRPYLVPREAHGRKATTGAA